MKINFLGDSITYGYELDNKDVWTALIQEKRKEDIIINRGISGDSTAGMLTRFQTEILTDTPDIMHLMGGLNDVFSGAKAKHIQANFFALSHQAKFYGIKTVVGICPLPIKEMLEEDFKAFIKFDDAYKQMKKLNQWLRRYNTISDSISIIDYEKELKNYYQGNIQDLYLDGVHLNEQGNKVLAQIFLDNFSV
ncbi:GDSL-type esterase/lipase family protein [Pasteurella skyensis]|uniref:GDSL-type esterase/lipase family protein n=1 Tax=Phocoenobacter skyensis TaxID=97481 RepID=A0AAJ6NZR7_9PAST|nr:GDSL-type esterase/lipase family protein [Pasteurella skyensis]MDP8161639.1 GDSL-type esterase/lipase family protein [Pasteurella skyensis]MDP8171795.1 GDSL-type esterase/lipase family protein [Pasteurella skyensis]MDP8176033.1 GDSL-type esterase/lipase family protein [Pasteurella skyensis]MDP8178001.1 GDSL-type esterase/lipase family protein [Pasteurella skyensis]MDP8182340.1 GDSL-type esterase/lipase family protein [Pasteurella skyensis]